MLHFFDPPRGVPSLTRDDPAAFAPPAAFGPFRVLHQIGSGALGPVFRTHEPTRGRLVAVKVFRLDITPEQAQALAVELTKAADAGLFHPSIVEPIGAGVHETVAYRAEEYVAADSLDSAIRHYAPAPVARVLPFVTQLAGAIDFARAAGVGHGALHLRDIFVTPDDVRASGFGVVEALERVGLRAPVRRPYSAPERIAGDAWSTPADLFSLAVITFELMTGRRPSGIGDQIGELDAAQVGADPAAVRAVLAKATAELPADRYATALEFASALEVAAHGARVDPERAPELAPAIASGVAGADDTDDVDHADDSVAEDAAPDRAAHPEAAADGKPEAAADWEPEAAADWEPEAAADWEPEAAADWEDDAQGDRPIAVVAEPVDRPVVEEELDAYEVEAGEKAGELDIKPVHTPSLFDDEDEAPADRLLPSAGERFADDFAEPETPAAVAVLSIAGPAHADPDASLREPDPGPGEAEGSLREYDSEDPDPRSAFAREEPTLVAAAPARSSVNEAPVAEVTRRPMLPFAMGLIAGLLIGFAIGHLVGGRDRGPAAAPASVAATETPATETPRSTTEATVARTPAVPPPVPGETRPVRPAPAPTRGRLLITSTPTNASVTLNDKWSGRTPLTVNALSFGSYSVRVVRPGFAVAREDFTLSAAQPSRTLSFRLKPMAPAPAAAAPPPVTAAPTRFVGAIYVDSRPRGARVFIDGKEVATTPARLPEIAVGSHVVRLELEGHRPWSRVARVTAGKDERVTGSLERIQ